MTTDNRKPIDPNDPGLNGFFEAERDHPTPATTRLLSAVTRDALTTQVRRSVINKDAGGGDWRARLGEFWREFWRALGGLPAATVLGLFLLAGLSLGVTPPESLGRLSDEILSAAGLASQQSVDYTLDDLTGEG